MSAISYVKQIDPQRGKILRNVQMSMCVTVLSNLRGSYFKFVF